MLDRRRSATQSHRGIRGPWPAVVIAAGGLLVVGVVAMALGRYPVPVGHVVEILVGQVTGRAYPGPVTEHDVVMLVRLPRVLLGALVGGGLAVSGVALQAAFRNPLVSPQVIGVLVRRCLRRGPGPGARARDRIPRGVGVRLRDGRPRRRLPRHRRSRWRVDADDRPRRCRHRVVLQRPGVAADLPRGPLHDAARDRVLAARQPGHRDLREGARRRRPGARRHHGAACPPVAHQRAVAGRRGRRRRGDPAPAASGGRCSPPWRSSSPVRSP